MDIDDAGQVQLDRVARISAESSAAYRRTLLAQGDLVVSVVGTIGKTFVVAPDLVGANLSRALARIQLSEGADPHLVKWSFKTSGFADFVERVTQATAQNVINLEDLAAFPVYTPGDLGTSRRLAATLASLSDLHQHALDSLENQAALLVERRQAIITAAVTGLLEIPGLAA